MPVRGSGHHADRVSPGDAATDRFPKSNVDQARSAAQEFVAITLVGPLLAQARQDPFRSDLFHGGFAEDAFGAQLDSIIAQRITRATDLSIVDAVYNQLTATGTKVNAHG